MVNLSDASSRAGQVGRIAQTAEEAARATWTRQAESPNKLPPPGPHRFRFDWRKAKGIQAQTIPFFSFTRRGRLNRPCEFPRPRSKRKESY
jgi:hypothetical protein